MKARPSFVLVVTLIVLIALPNPSNQQYYAGNYADVRSWDPNYYDNYYKYTHNRQASIGYYGYAYGQGGSGGGIGGGGIGGGGYPPSTSPPDYNRRAYDAPSVVGADYGRNYYADRYSSGSSSSSSINYYTPPGDYNSYYSYNGFNNNGFNRNYYDAAAADYYYYYNRAGRSNNWQPYGASYNDYDYSRGYPVTPGQGTYDYFYGRSVRENTAKNVDPFPGKYLGLGSVQYASGRRDVDLRCNLSKDGQKVVSNVIWVKVENAYRHDYRGIIPPEGYATNPYYCPSGGCIYRDIDFSNKRFFADMHGEVATLHIYDTQPRDYGVYRCSASGQASTSASDTETTYQIVEYFD